MHHRPDRSARKFVNKLLMIINNIKSVVDNVLKCLLRAHPSLTHLHALFDLPVPLQVQANELRVKPDELFQLPESFPGELVFAKVDILNRRVVQEVIPELTRCCIREIVVAQVKVFDLDGLA